MKFSIKDFSSKCDQIRRKLRIWSMENFIFCAVMVACFENEWQVHDGFVTILCFGIH